MVFEVLVVLVRVWVVSLLVMLLLLPLQLLSSLVFLSNAGQKTKQKADPKAPLYILTLVQLCRKW